jgi:hypothetical protein
MQVTGEPLVKRSDDNPTTLRKRLESGAAHEKPLLDFYEKKGKSSDVIRKVFEMRSCLFISVIVLLVSRLVGAPGRDKEAGRAVHGNHQHVRPKEERQGHLRLKLPIP